MAISGLLQNVFVVFPTTLSLIFGRWVLGEFFCYLQECLHRFAFNTVTVFLTAVLTTSKLGIVKYSLRTGSWSSMFGHKICAAVWLFSLGFTAPKLRNIKGTVFLSYSSYMCKTEYNADFYPDLFAYYEVATSVVVP